ncbi:MAG: hypothetical protein Ct9H90mP23_2070 [Methanobacteriota archaeon]|nr:MAG: hypothetical protein Ct9H90mP23_2070 [Euryarchaeota archaeon]
MLFGKWIPDKFGFENHKIDGGKIHSDGNRLLGMVSLGRDLLEGGLFWNTGYDFALHLGRKYPFLNRPFIDPLLISEPTDWFWIGNEWSAAFVLGFTLGLACMLGDMAGSFEKTQTGAEKGRRS